MTYIHLRLKFNRDTKDYSLFKNGAFVATIYPNNDGALTPDLMVYMHPPEALRLDSLMHECIGSEHNLLITKFNNINYEAEY